VKQYIQNLEDWYTKLAAIAAPQKP
jgi:hypothetical protein